MLLISEQKGPIVEKEGGERDRLLSLDQISSAILTEKSCLVQNGLVTRLAANSAGRAESRGFSLRP